MLVELLVENYAVIERVRVRFYRGLNLLTGETGSGKSIVVGALSLLLGGRADSGMVRTGADRARVAGIFEAPSSVTFQRLLEDNGVVVEDDELLIEREVLAGGKSRAFLGARPVTVALLREIAPHLGDIHGQHDQQELFSASSQLEMLDEYSGAGPLLERLRDTHAEWRRCSAELEELDRGEQEKLRLADLWSFQRREIEEIAPQPGEDADLEQERRVLLNVTRLQEQAGAAYEALYEAPGAALGQIRQARRRLEELARIDASLEAAAGSLEPAEIAVDEAAHALRSYLGKLESDPGRLEEIEARLAALDKLKRKYGSTIEETLAFLEDVREKLTAIETAGERREKLARDREQLAAKYEQQAGELSGRRRDAADRLQCEVERELASLAMAGCVFRVEFSASDWTPRGVDRIRFLVSPNAGEEPRPLDRIASGGELSRLALAVKTCIAAGGGPRPQADATPRTLVFDEVDAGIGGGTAEAVGRRLKRLAGSNQLLCVTHLPQIAALADRHYAVGKRESGGRTTAFVEELDKESRTKEVGRMLSGAKTTPEALRQAEQLIRAGSR
jgi:DNA repair protein RecN (Recombination protein N)